MSSRSRNEQLWRCRRTDAGTCGGRICRGRLVNDYQPPSVRVIQTRASAVCGPMVDLISVTLSAGKPPSRACRITASALAAS